jgi:DNA polymerase III subunit delta'
VQFKDIVGQQAVKNKLIAGVKDGRVPHAQLLLGPEGSGNLALALAYAQYIACPNKTDADSCGTCASCIKYGKIIHPDLHFTFPTVGSKEISDNFMEEWRATFLANPYLNVFDWLMALQAENKQGNITVDECRNIIKKLSLKSFEGNFKVLIMWMPEYLGKEGNTLLKLIEEPPQKTLFLLVANSDEQILGTIKSRTQLVKIPALGTEDVQNALVERQGAEPEVARAAAFLAEGNLNLAVRLLSQTENNFFESFRNWMLMCYKNDMGGVLGWIDEAATMGREIQKHFLAYGLHILRECLIIKNTDGQMVKLTEKERDFVSKFANFLNPQSIEKISNAFNNAIYHIERNANAKITLINISLLIKNNLAAKTG